MEDLISIIIPVYNVEKYIKECLDSIINQTYKNIEIILIDDGSKDNSGKICDEFAEKDKRIKVLHKENGGLSSARNAGLDIANGNYISFIDSDDYVSYEFIEKLYKLCTQNDADIAVCDYMKFIGKAEVKKVRENIEIYDSYDIQKHMYSKEYEKTVIVTNKLYKSYIYEKLRFPEGKINEDAFTIYKAYYNTKKSIISTNEILYFYRNNENSIMGRKYNIKRLDVLDAYKERKEFYKKLNEKELYELTIIKYHDFIIDNFIDTLEFIENSQIILEKIWRLAEENYRDYKAIKNKSLKSRIKVNFFMKMPYVYIYLIRIKRLIK